MDPNRPLISLTNLSRRLSACVALLLSAFVAGCGGGGGGGGGTSAPAGVVTCPAVAQSEAAMTARLSQAESEVDFSFAVERKDGRRYNYNRGASTLQKAYESASTSKLVAAVVIMRLVEQGYLSLEKRPQDLIDAWPLVSSDPMYGMTLRNLLSLTAGFTQDPPCLDSPTADFEACVIEVGNVNAGNGSTAGRQFIYVSADLQVAGLMAVKARRASWEQIFAEFKTQTGLFAGSAFDVPSTSNPLMGGGMHVTGADYMDFLKALKGGALLNAASMSQLLTDYTASVRIAFSPIRDGIAGDPGLGEDWHYGFGLWHECRSAVFNCVPATRVSSPGNFGSYPFWDRSKDYTGVVARQGASGHVTTGIKIERSVRSEVEQWAACSN
ncbi:MAG: serine hydrolase domain-containing protein [Betaproteobacteria bacterium]